MSEPPLRMGEPSADHGDDRVVTRCIWLKGPPAPRWAVKPEVTYGESGWEWPKDDQ
jgi:hypothetical protein